MLSLEKQSATVAATMCGAYERFCVEFAAITRLSRHLFEGRDWEGVRVANLRRLDVYSEVLGELVDRLEAELGEALRDTELWKSVKAEYARLTDTLPDFEIAESFYNSTTRRIFHTEGVDPRIDFTVSRRRKLREDEPSISVCHYPGRSTERFVKRILRDYGFEYADLDRDAALAGARIDEFLASEGGHPIVQAEMLQPVFFRNKGAYVVGRLQAGSRVYPVVFALVHPPEGVLVDAVLLEENAVSIVFSFTRSYFHVDARSPSQVVGFLRSILPRKPVHELYASLGFNRHAKTRQYRDFLHHLKESDDQFVPARGKKGMVMAVFTLPSYDLVFKVIRDHFPMPKRTTRRQVMEKYRLVFQHDRVGRMVDANEFEHATLDRVRVSDEVLDELLQECSQMVRVEGETVFINHLYTERRIEPLDLYLNEASPEDARRAALDYGAAIKDLAAANIFPGDMFTKNFGVTRHGRVVFYDYDEISLLTDCVFRTMPAAQFDEDDYCDEPCFYVGPNDVFPEEFRRFIGLRPDLREAFEAQHADLFTVEYWQGLQDRVRAGVVLDVYPYPQEVRLTLPSGSPTT